MYRRTRKGARAQRHSNYGFDAVDVLLRPELAEHEDFHDGWAAIRPRTFASSELREREQILVTRQDEQKLRRLLREYRPYVDPAMLAQLEAELDRALLVDAQLIPADVVTMNSRVLYEDQDSGDCVETRLVYRDGASRGESQVSVLAPVGAALLGLTVGQTITWPVSERDAIRLRVAALMYQPEDAGASA